MAARTALTGINVPASSSRTPLEVTYTAADATNGNVYTLTGRDTVLFKNSHAANAITVTVTVPTDPLGNQSHITTFSITALKEYVMPQPAVDVFGQPGGLLFLNWAGTGTPTVAILVNPI